MSEISRELLQEINRHARSEMEAATRLRAEHAERLARYSRRCTTCGGSGGIAYQGRSWSNDPANWDLCGICEGTGWEGGR